MRGVTTPQIAIVVTGSVSVLVGLGGPALFALFEQKREKARFAHERGLRERDALRLRLDGVADALDTLKRRGGAQFGVLATQGPDSEDLGRATFDALAAVHDAQLAVAKLSLSIRTDEGAGRAASVSLRELDEIATTIADQWSLRRYADDFSFDDLQERQNKAGRAASEFLALARERWGVQ